MRWWRNARDESLTARIAVPSDRSAVAQLIAGTWRRHGAPALEDQGALLRGGISAVAFAGNALVGFLGQILREATGSPPETWSDLVLIAVDADRPVIPVLQMLAETAVAAVSRSDCTGLVCLAPAGWLTKGLEPTGFLEAERVMTWMHSDPSRVQPLGTLPPVAELRSATGRDAETVLSLNALAFEPLWRYDDTTLVSWLLMSEHAMLAHIEGQPVGFSLTTAGMPGQVAHLIRLAVHPDFRERGLGRLLVTDALKFAYEGPTPGLALNTQVGNIASRNLYESLGFRPTGQVASVMIRRV